MSRRACDDVTKFVSGMDGSTETVIKGVGEERNRLGSREEARTHAFEEDGDHSTSLSIYRSFDFFTNSDVQRRLEIRNRGSTPRLGELTKTRARRAPVSCTVRNI